MKDWQKIRRWIDADVSTESSLCSDEHKLHFFKSENESKQCHQ